MSYSSIVPCVDIPSELDLVNCTRARTPGYLFRNGQGADRGQSSPPTCSTLMMTNLENSGRGGATTGGQLRYWRRRLLCQ